MLNISVNLETGQARLAQTTAIKAGGGVPVRVVFSANPGDNPVIELALSPQSSEREILAYLDVFAAENSTTFLGTLDANDTRLLDHLAEKAVAQVTLDVELVVVRNLARRPFPNFQITCQAPTITGPASSEGGPVYLTLAQGDARYTQPDDVIPAAAKAAANGVASLDGTGKVPTAQLPDAVLGALKYRGGWNAATNTPDITLSAQLGHYWLVTVAGTNDPDAAGRTFEPGDWIVYNGSAWDKIDNTEPVASTILAGIARIATAVEANQKRAENLIVTPARMRSQTAQTLSADLTLTSASDERQLLVPQTVDRNVTLPAIATVPAGDQVGPGHTYTIIHDGAANSLLVLSAAAVLQDRIDPGESLTLIATATGWIAAKQFAAGPINIIARGIDFTAAIGNTILFTPPPGLSLVVLTAPMVIHEQVSGTISTAAQIRLDNGTDGADVTNSTTLTSPAAGRAAIMSLGGTPRVVTPTAPLRLRRTVAAAGTTPVHTGTIIVTGTLI